MRKFNCFSRLFLRFRYPVTLPEDIAKALGIHVSNYVTFDEFFSTLTSPECHPTNIKKFMPRHEVEFAFTNAQRKEHFRQMSLYSYYFSEGWIEFKLEFDSNSLLRRIYIQHRNIQDERGIELQLASAK